MNKAPKKHNNSQVQGLVLVMGVFPASIKKIFQSTGLWTERATEMVVSGSVARERRTLLQQGVRDVGPQRTTVLSRSPCGFSSVVFQQKRVARTGEQGLPIVGVISFFAFFVSRG